MTIKYYLLSKLIDVLDAVIDTVMCVIGWRWFSPRFVAYRLADVLVFPVLNLVFAVLERVLGADHPMFKVTPDAPTDFSGEDFTLRTSNRRHFKPQADE